MGTGLAMPSAEELNASLVRVDPIEAWALRLYAVQALPGYARFVRKAILCLCRDGRVLYFETEAPALRLFQFKRWVGKLEDLGEPQPVPVGFEAAKSLRLHGRVSDRSFVVRIDGQPKIIYFTGREREAELRGLASLVHLIPHVGELIEGAEILTDKVANLGGTDRAVAAATLWRSVLNRTTRPATLPLLAG